MNVAEAVTLIETAGATLRLEGQSVRVRYPDEEHRKELAKQVAFLREHKTEVAAFLKARSTVPKMSPGVRLIQWNLKEPPVAIEICAVVTDPAKFARATLEELRERLRNPERKYGWSAPQLLDRLAQVGVIVVLESEEPCS